MTDRTYSLRYQGPAGVQNLDTDRAGALAFLSKHGVFMPSSVVARAESEGESEGNAFDGGSLYISTDADETPAPDYFDYSAHFNGIALDAENDAHGNPTRTYPVLGFEQGQDGKPIAFLAPAAFDAFAQATAHAAGEDVRGLDAMAHLGLTVEVFTDAHGAQHFAAVLTSDGTWSPVRS